MIPIGYLYKKVAARPDWICAENVEDIYSLSGCESENFTDYTSYWRHNEYWLFNSPDVMEALASEHSISLDGLRLFYYEVYKEEFIEDLNAWRVLDREASFETNVQTPRAKTLEEFDVTCFQMHNSPECSPLSCNSHSETIPTNRHCLFNTFQEAKGAIEQGLFAKSEPGPFCIIAVYTVDEDRV